MILHNGIAIIERDTHLSKWVIEHNRLDFDQNSLPTYLPFINPGDAVLDLGANIGCYAYAFAKKGAKVICFEPNPEALECLVHNMQGQNVIIYASAVSDTEDFYEVNADHDNVGMAFINPGKGSAKTVRIDNVISEKITFIKMDVEGYELHALKGAEQTINKYRPVMVIEINDHTLKRTGIDRKEIFAWLDEHSYIYRNIYARQGMNDDQLDIICFPK